MLERFLGRLGLQSNKSTLEVHTLHSFTQGVEKKLKDNWDEFSFQIGRIVAGGNWNSQNDNIPDYGPKGWLELMVKEKRLRKKGIRKLGEGIMSVVHERAGEGANETDLFPLRLVADNLFNEIGPKINRRGEDGERAMQYLQTMIGLKTSVPPANSS